MSNNKKGAFNPEPQKKLLPEQKISNDYGKKKYNSYGTQAHDGLIIPQVKRHMKIIIPKMKEDDIFDTKGDGKASKYDPEKKNLVGKVNNKDSTKGRFVYNYKKRI
tara:strand:- start:303 stop:620 length:318 start_codon:yes stop_codon:yes gene_type:complete